MATTTGPSATMTAPSLVGVWIHAVTDPDGTERNYPYQSSERGETVDVESVSLKFVGRRYQVVEFGDLDSHSLGLSIKIPLGPTHNADVEALRGFVRGRATICYRDNRGRLIFGVLMGGAAVTDSTDGGSVVGVTVQRVDYNEAA